MAQVGVVGTTSWGTTLAILLGRSGHDVTIWARTESDADLLRATRRNDRFLPGVDFPDGLKVSANADEAFGHAELVLLAVPSSSVAENAMKIASSVPASAIVISATAIAIAG